MFFNWEDGDGVNLCLDSIIQFENVAEDLQQTCETLAPIIGCDSMVKVGELSLGLATVCCSTCQGIMNKKNNFFSLKLRRN